MKNIRNFFALTLTAMFALVLTGCDKSPQIDGRPDDPEGEQATLAIVDPRLETTDELFMDAEDDTATEVSELATSLVVESNYSTWTVNVTTADATWCKVFTSKDNDPETDDLALIELTANAGLDNRSAVIRFSAGKGEQAVTKDITVTQFGYAPSIMLTPATSPIYAKAEGETIPVSVAANIDWDYDTSELPDWIRDVTVPTRAATTNTALKFEVDPNTELGTRTATIPITTDVEDFDAPAIVITQLGEAAAIAIDGDLTKIVAVWDQTEVDFDVTANIGYAVSFEGLEEGDPVPDWIAQAPASRVMETNNLAFTLTNNEEVATRSAVIVLTSTNTDNPDVEARLTVEQVGNVTMTLDSTTPAAPLNFEFDEEPAINVVLETNIPLGDEALEVTHPVWITRGTDTEDAEAGTMTLVFNVAQNLVDSDRNGNIVISYPGEEDITLSVSQKGQERFLLQVPMVSADVDNKLSGGSTVPARYIDGDKSTFVDTNYNSASTGGFTTTTITLVSGIGASMERVVMFPRSTSTTNLGQMPKTLTFAYSTMDAPETFINIEGTYPVDNTGVTMETGVTINFPRVDNVHTLKVIATESYSPTFICLSEIEVWGNQGQNYGYMSVAGAEDYAIPSTGGTIDFTVATNLAYNVTLPAGFTGEELPSTRALPPFATKTYRVTVPASDGTSIGLGGGIVFKSLDGKFTQAFKEGQPGSYYDADNTSNGTITATAMALNTSDELVTTNREGQIVNMLDGLTATGAVYWHADYSSSMKPIDATNPAILEFTFNDAPAQVSMVRYWPRGGNGDFYQFKIFVKPAGGDYPATPNYERTTDARIQTGPFDCPFDTVENPASVKIEVTKGHGTWASAREIQFFQ